MNTATIDLDIAKTLFQVHGMDERGKPTVCRQLKRADVTRFFANLPPFDWDGGLRHCSLLGA